MKAKVYDEFIINVTNSGDVHIVFDAGVATLPVGAIKLIADESGIIDNIKGELHDAYEEISRQHGVIKDLEGDIKRLKDENTRLNRELLERGEGNEEPDVEILGTTYKAVGHELVHLDGEFIADCGTPQRASTVAKALYEGKVTLEQVKLLFGD